MSNKFIMDIPQKVTSNKIYSGIHWGTRKGVVDKYHKAISLLKLKMRLNKSVDIIIKFYFKNRPLDCSNCFFMSKCIEDGLVKEKILIDDSPEYVMSITCISHVDKNNPRIEVELKE